MTWHRHKIQVGDLRVACSKATCSRCRYLCSERSWCSLWRRHIKKKGGSYLRCELCAIRDRSFSVAF
jgi:hypothetical protein